MKKVRFPREIVPLSSIAGQAFTAATMFVILFPLCLLFTPGSFLPLVALPGLVLLLAVLTIGFGLMLAALNVYFRDVEHILAALALPWFFLTPIFYSLDANSLPVLAGRPSWVIDLLTYGNPITPYVETIRDVLFYGRWPNGVEVIYCVLVAAAMLAIGVLVFRRLEREMAVEL